MRDAVELHFGDAGLGSSLASLQVKYLSLVTGMAVIRSGREEMQQVISAVMGAALLLQGTKPQPGSIGTGGHGSDY